MNDVDDDDGMDCYIADEIKAGRCPFGMLNPGETISTCPHGFPGCGCGDELMLNPFLQCNPITPG